MTIFNLGKRRRLTKIDDLLDRDEWLLAGKLLMKFLARFSPNREVPLWPEIREQERVKSRSINLAIKALQEKLSDVYKTWISHIKLGA